MVTPALFAGVVYDFQTVTSAQGNDTTMKGVAYVEGGNMRMEIVEGDGEVFQSDSVLISADGGSTILVLDEGDQTYWELNVDDLFNQLGAMMEAMGSNMEISVKPKSVDVRDVGDGGKIEGYSTRKYDMTADYTIEMAMMGMNMNVEVDSETTIWATPELSAEYATFFQAKGVKTGLEDLDELIGQYAEKIKGFPLRTEQTSTVRMMGRDMPSKSTTTVSNVREEAISADRFEVPSDYRQVDSPMDAAMRGMRQ